METKKTYQQPKIETVMIEEQIIAASNDLDSQSIYLDVDLTGQEEGYAD